MYLHLLVLLICSPLLTLGHFAPNDTGTYCRDMSALPDYPQTVKRLMDSWSYQSLSQPWTLLDLDNDTITWAYITGETCRQKIRIQEPQTLPQDNWIITQYIHKSIPPQYNTNPTRIYINISYILDSSCSQVTCHTNFQLLYHLANASNHTMAQHTPGYTLLANVTSNDDTSVHMKTFNFVMQPWNTGFYVAIRDMGSNITINRLFVYRLVGPEIQNGLTLYPQVPAPTTECVNVTGTCAANANTTSGRPPVLRLDPNGSWSEGEGCLCIEGHTPATIEGTQQCQACLPSTYKSSLSNTNCRSCPTNSFSTDHGVSICTCSNGYYRAPIETADNPCTGAPSAPTRLSVSSPTNVTVNIAWDPPSSNGGRTDLFYNIYVIRVLNFSNVIKVNPQPVVNVTSYYIQSLEPKSLYFVRVVSENGVSNQTSPDRRTVSSNFYTTDGVALQVSGVRVVSEMFVEWTLLSDSDRGRITKYQVQFTSSGGNNGGRIIDLDRSTAVYQVNVTMDFPTTGQPVYVSVRGFTDVGAGEWSVPVLFAQVNSLIPVVSSSSLSTTSPSSVLYTAVSSSTVTMTTTSNPSSTSTSSSSSTSQTRATPSATPTESTGSPAYISIVAVLGGAILIIILVAAGAFGYFIFRRLRIKYMSKSSGGRDETDDTEGLINAVKYEKVPGSEDEERVQFNPMAETT